MITRLIRIRRDASNDVTLKLITCSNAENFKESTEYLNFMYSNGAHFCDLDGDFTVVDNNVSPTDDEIKDAALKLYGQFPLKSNEFDLIRKIADDAWENGWRFNVITGKVVAQPIEA